MVTGPGDELAAGSRGRMRAGDADREQVIDALKAAFVQGRLAKAEFDARIGRAFASRTYADLAGAMADMPAGPTGAGAPPPRHSRHQTRPPAKSAKKVAISVACAVLGAELVLLALIITIPVFFTLDLAVLANLLGLPLAGGLVLDTWRASRGRGPLPPAVPPQAWMTVSAFDCVSSSHWRPDWRP